MKMTIQVDFNYDGDMVDMAEVQKYLKSALESGAESTCSELKLLKVISPEPTLPAVPKNGDLALLPVGTVFWVNNGHWDGEIVEVEGQKCVHILATGRTVPIREDHGLSITITGYKIPVD